MLERARVVGIGAIELREQERNVLEPRVGVCPAHEAVERPGVALVMAGMELLEVLPAFCLGPGQRDLDDLAHLRRPSPERLDELTQREAAGRLRSKFVFMDVLHGARILAAVRRALTKVAPATERACDV